MEQTLVGKINQLDCIDRELEQHLGVPMGNNWQVFKCRAIAMLAELMVDAPALGFTGKTIRLLQEREEVAEWIRRELRQNGAVRTRNTGTLELAKQ
jgi:hypothetical protein